MSSPADMPKRRPVHTARPPLEHRSPTPPPRWSCRKKGYPNQQAAEAQLEWIWAQPGLREGPMEARAYRCPRHTREVWHLTKQDREEQA